MAKEVLLTEEGLKNLENELEELKNVRRKEIAEKIKVALSFGDLSENSEYDEAKNEQAIVESRITTIETMLQNVKIIDENEIDTDKVFVGSKVKIHELSYNEINTYRIVGSSEADPINGKISDESPVGKALIGRKVGDKFDVEAPGGVVKYQVLEISK